MATADRETIELAVAAYQAGLSGEFSNMDGCMPRLQSIDLPISGVWVQALNGLRWHAEPDSRPLPRIAELEPYALGSRDERYAAALAAAHGAHASGLTCDAERLDAWVGLLARLSEQGDLESGSLLLSFYRAWSDVGLGRFEQAETTFGSLPRRAAALGMAALVIDATAMQGLALASLGRIAESLPIVRRASRMARSEELPQSEYLANWVLARVRRLSGRAHLSTRILNALLQVAPRPWRGVLGWELVLAGDTQSEPNDAVDDQTPIGVAAQELRASIASARNGRADEFRRHAGTTINALGGCQPFSGELAEVLTAIDATQEPGASTVSVRDWCLGAADIPPSLRGLCKAVHASGLQHPTAVLVSAGPGKQARRILGLGAPLVDSDQILTAPRQGHGRLETTVAALTLAGANGLTRSDLFHKVYGFEYVHGRHEGLLRVLVHRARKELAGVGSLDFEKDHLHIRLVRAVIVPDPRCEQPVEDVMLRFLARSGAQGTKATAAELKVSLRKAQLILTGLANEGAVVMERAGRNVTYRVEDTTFQEPTRFKKQHGRGG